jgi:hypothetical protein
MVTLALAKEVVVAAAAPQPLDVSQEIVSHQETGAQVTTVAAVVAGAATRIMTPLEATAVMAALVEEEEPVAARATSHPAMAATEASVAAAVRIPDPATIPGPVVRSAAMLTILVAEAELGSAAPSSTTVER